MAWDYTGAKLVIAPASWAKGNGKSNQNTGNFPSWPNGDYQNCVLTDMALNDGYVYTPSPDRGVIKGDGVNNNLTSQYPVALTNTSKLTIEVKCVYKTMASNQCICAAYDDVNNNFACILDAANRFKMRFAVGGSVQQVRSSAVLSNGTGYTLHFIKNGADLKLGLDGVEVGSYDDQDSYSLGNKTYTGKMNFLERSSDFPYKGDLRWLCIYEDQTFDFARALTNFNLPLYMDLTGNNTGDVMSFGILGGAGRLGTLSRGLNRGLNRGLS